MLRPVGSANQRLGPAATTVARRSLEADLARADLGSDYVELAVPERSVIIGSVKVGERPEPVTVFECRAAHRYLGRAADLTLEGKLVTVRQFGRSALADSRKLASGQLSYELDCAYLRECELQLVIKDLTALVKALRGDRNPPPRSRGDETLAGVRDAVRSGERVSIRGRETLSISLGRTRSELALVSAYIATNRPLLQALSDESMRGTVGLYTQIAMRSTAPYMQKIGCGLSLAARVMNAAIGHF